MKSIIYPILILIGLLAGCVSENSIIKESDNNQTNQSNDAIVAYPTSFGNLLVTTNPDYSGLKILNVKTNKVVSIKDLGAGYKPSLALDKRYISFRGVIPADGNTSKQNYLGYIDISSGDVKIFPSGRRIQPPFWYYGSHYIYLMELQNETRIYKLDSLKYSSESSRDSILSLTAINKQLLFRDSGLWLWDSTWVKPIMKNAFDPTFSLDHRLVVFSNLEGSIFLIELNTGLITKIGEGLQPSISPSGNKICYLKAVDDGHVLTSSEIFLMDISSGITRQLTHTEGLIEYSPSFTSDSSIIYTDYQGTKLFDLNF